MTIVRRDGADSNDMSARSVGVFEPHPSGEVTDEQFERIRALMDPGAKIEKSDVYGFRMIACSDGLDAYYTRQHPERSLKRMASDLTLGQALLANHDYGTLSYGSSYSGEVIDADALSPAYEGTFYPQHDRPEHRTTKWLVGEYFIPRGLTLNGQPTDDLIRSMEMGAQRKASITFAVGSYECAIDGKDLLMGFEALFVDPDEIECRHFPGLSYGDDLCYAWMKDNTLLETSMVYKNASPSSMLLRKAEGMATRGMIPAKELTRLEERIGQRLPRPQATTFPGASARAIQEDRQVTKRDTTPATPDSDAPDSAPAAPPAEPTTPADKPADAPAAPAPGTGTDSTDGTGGSADEGGSGQEGRSTETTVADFVSATERVVSHITSGQPSDEDLEAVAEAERNVEEALEAAGSEASVGHGVARQYDARQRLVTEALGEEPTVEAIRSLSERAALGDELYAVLVEDAVQARTRALGEHANADAYRDSLLTQRNVAYVKAEVTAYGSISRTALAPVRQVTPREPTETKAPRQAPKEPKPEGREQSNILAPR